MLNNFRPREYGFALAGNAGNPRHPPYATNSFWIRVERHNDNECFEFGGMHVNVFSPPGLAYCEVSRNNDSLVLRFRFDDSSVLLKGDAERWSRKSVRNSSPTSVGLLQAGHHGSFASTSSELLRLHPIPAMLGDYFGRGEKRVWPSPTVRTLRRLQKERRRCDLLHGPEWGGQRSILTAAPSARSSACLR